MNWFKRWKAKHWNEIEHAPKHGEPWHLTYKETPRLKAFWLRLIDEIENNPIKGLTWLGGTLAAVFAALGWLIRGLVC